MIKIILVPVDFSEITGTVIETAATLGKQLSAQLMVIHVAAPDPDFIGFQVGPEIIRNIRAETLRKEHRELQDIALQLRERNITVTALLVQGSTVDTILEHCRKHQADMIILGSHGRSPISKALLGSTSEEVLRHAACPVLIVPSEGHK